MQTPFRDFDAKCNGVPCVKDCPDRNAECHAICERYALWKEKYIQKKEKLDEYRHRESDYYRFKESIKRHELKRKNKEIGF